VSGKDALPPILPGAGGPSDRIPGGRGRRAREQPAKVSLYRDAYRGWWTRLGHALGWFNTRVILTLIFMIVITPFSFVMWVFGRDRMKRGFDPKVETYRVPSPPRPPQGMEKPF
jgi:saxitoxin biosynthesis operon SxtJ-like protein